MYFVLCFLKYCKYDIDVNFIIYKRDKIFIFFVLKLILLYYLKLNRIMQIGFNVFVFVYLRLIYFGFF